MMKKFWCTLMAGLGLLAMASGVQAAGMDVYTNSCNNLAEWQDNSSGTMSVQNDGTKDYVHFVSSVTGATLTFRPNLASGIAGVSVRAGYKLVFDAQGWAQDFSINYTDRNTNTLYWLTGVSGNPWIGLDSGWQHFELTIPADGVADYISFNIYTPGQQANIANLKIVNPAFSQTYTNSCNALTEWLDNSSGTLTVQSGGFIRFVGNGGATLTLIPNVSGVTVKAGDKLVFDAKGYAQDFYVNLTINGTWYNLTGVSGNPWITLGSAWQRFELTMPADGLVSYICFNIYAAGHEVNIDNAQMVTPVLPVAYTNPCDELTEWRDNSSGTMAIQSSGPSGTSLRFVSTVQGATMTLVPNVSTTGSVTVKAGDKLAFDAKGYAQDFFVNLTINGIWYNLTGVSGNPWVTLGSEWQHFELTVPADGLASYISFNIYSAGQEISVDNLQIISVPKVETPVFAPEYRVISGPRTVTMTCATTGATIRYTTDGSDPTAASAIYTAAVGVDNNVILKAKAFAPGYVASTVKSVTYTIPSTFDGPAEIGHSNTIIVDGNLAEWATSDFVSLNKDYEGEAWDISEAWYAAKWNSSGKIYVAVKVLDTNHCFTTNYTGYDARDAVEVYLHTQGITGIYYGTWEVAQQYVFGIKAGTTNQLWASMSDTGSVNAAADFQMAGKIAGQWLYYEFALTPYDYFGGYTAKSNIVTTLSANDIVGLDVVVASCDSYGTYTGMKSENEKRNKSYDWNKFGLHKLAAAPTLRAGDANGDGMVDVGDLGILAANYGGSGKTWTQGDFNGDTLVDVGDLGILAAHYGEGSTQTTSFSEDYSKAFGTTVTDDTSAQKETSAVCGALGLPLIAGLMLTGLMLGGMLKMKE
jgi:hypothetical protein